MAELHEVDAWLDALLAQLAPAARRKMLREVAREVRRIQQANITAQRAPDGTAWEPRRVSARSKPGRIRRKMFAKLKTAKYLKAQANENQAIVFFSQEVQRIARVHHYGLREKLNGREFRYISRTLLGINGETLGVLSRVVLNWIGNDRKPNN